MVIDLNVAQYDWSITVILYPQNDSKHTEYIGI